MGTPPYLADPPPGSTNAALLQGLARLHADDRVEMHLLAAPLPVEDTPSPLLTWVARDALADSLEGLQEHLVALDTAAGDASPSPSRLRVHLDAPPRATYRATAGDPGFASGDVYVNSNSGNTASAKRWSQRSVRDGVDARVSGGTALDEEELAPWPVPDALIRSMDLANHNESCVAIAGPPSDPLPEPLPRTVREIHALLAADTALLAVPGDEHVVLHCPAAGHGALGGVPDAEALPRDTPAVMFRSATAFLVAPVGADEHGGGADFPAATSEVLY